MLRVVSRWEVVALSINDVVGSGVYLLPAAAAALLGAASLWAVSCCRPRRGLLVLCFAEAAQPTSTSRAAPTSTRAAAFGELRRLRGGLDDLARACPRCASLSAGFAQALTAFWPAAAGGRSS